MLYGTTVRCGFSEEIERDDNKRYSSREDLRVCLNFLNFLLTGNHSKPSNVSRVISRIYCIGQEMHSGCLGS